ncbi:10524_t:CDS:2 [Rhizophagus irregularis]|nr:10524_t:CDS:2 [Rhizophagus irregularis]
MVIVTLKELSKKHSHQDEVSEQEESNDELENRTHFHQKTKSLPKKRAKNHIPKESNLDENEMLVGSYVIKLNDNLWAKEIVNKNADLDIPPNHALFSMMHSVKVTRKSSLSDEFTQMYHSFAKFRKFRQVPDISPGFGSFGIAETETQNGRNVSPIAKQFRPKH